MLGMWLYIVLLLYFLNVHNENVRKKQNTITTLPGILVPLATQKLTISQSDLFGMDQESQFQGYPIITRGKVYLKPTTVLLS